ncbi:PDZ/DHR/GLGF domain protein [Dictyocaulus viviparus]|uniref:PDZ/DHR/GLGF domain protein n=1 Tax=Dictyocaulus viviparus TaxID=29172 RepID=A0A0D8XIR9_DICVI|nr:PDZ/DHR/GLGF domain protein [Dictyocaulus viviparus]
MLHSSLLPFFDRFLAAYYKLDLEKSFRNSRPPKRLSFLGVVLDADRDKGVNGAVVKSICSKKAISLDGRIQNLRNVTSSQARAILRRTNLIGTQCNVTYITAADARVWKERFHRDSETEFPVVNRLSPKVFPKFYRSPYLSRKESLRDTDDTEPLSDTSEVAVVCSPSESSGFEIKETEEYKSTQLLEDFVLQIIQNALRDAIIEYLISTKITDFKPNVPSSVQSDKPTFEEISNESLQQSRAAFSSVTQLSSPDRHGSPPYTMLRKESQNSKVSNTSEENSEARNSLSSTIHFNTADDSKHKRLSFDETQPSSAREIAEVTERSNVPTTDQERVISRTDADLKTTDPIFSTVTANPSQQSKPVARSKFWGEARTVVLQREPNESFGISIVGGRVEVSQKGGLPGTGSTVSGIFIKSVLPNSPAGKSGMMNMDSGMISTLLPAADITLETYPKLVNDIDLRDATHEQAVNAIKNATNPVRFVLQSLHSCIPQQRLRSAQVYEAYLTAGETVLWEALSQHFHDHIVSTKSRNILRDENKPHSHGDELAKLILPLTSSDSYKCEFMQATESASRSMGHFQVKSTKSTKQSLSQMGSPVSPSHHESSMELRADLSKQLIEPLQPKDDLLSYASTSYETEDNEKKECVRKGSMNDQRKATQKSVTSIPCSSDKVQSIKRDSLRSGECRKEFDPSGISTSPLSAAQLQKDPDDNEPESTFGYTQGKIRRKYGSLSDNVMLVSCQYVPEAGLGISLAGNRDRNKNSTFVLGVKVQCPLTVRPGDELLEVNGQVLVGHSHLVASSIIRQCCENGRGLEIVVCRRDGSMDNVAIRSPETPTTSKNESTEPVMSPTIDVSSDSTLLNIENARKKSCDIERTVPIESGRETLIEIDKDGKGLGLSIVGGSDTVLGTVVIHEVYPDGAAAHDARLKPGDQTV